LINGKYTNNTQFIADSFNNFFVEIGPKLANTIDTSNKKSYENYLLTPCQSRFCFEYTNPTETYKIIHSFENKTSTGHDNISTKLLKEISDIVSNPLSIIINKSLHTGIFPDRLKIARVIPIFKMNDNTILDNYRPISLLPAISKIIEKIVFNQLYEYFTTNKLFYDSQYGYRKLHSTEYAALELVDRIKRCIDDSKIPFSIFLDMSKAFDTLNHEVLLYKLQYYGINGICLQWFKSYLTSRKQYVDFNGTALQLNILKLEYHKDQFLVHFYSLFI
jgi:hypothetical protein